MMLSGAPNSKRQELHLPISAVEHGNNIVTFNLLQRQKLDRKRIQRPHVASTAPIQMTATHSESDAPPLENRGGQSRRFLSDSEVDSGIDSGPQWMPENR
jgi:hypothetical protein